MNTVTVTAVRWDGGWELHIDADHCTQCRTLNRAEQAVRDYLDLDDPGTDHSDWTITVIPAIDSYTGPWRPVTVRPRRPAPSARRPKSRGGPCAVCAPTG